MILTIANMVCRRCIDAVWRSAEQSGLQLLSLELGRAEIKDPVPVKKLEDFEKSIREQGFEIINDRSAKIIEKIKSSVLEYIRLDREKRKTKLSQFIASRLNYEYTYLSHLFSSATGITIEQFQIQQRIELVKELLVYGQHSLSEIAHQLGFSSVHHLSSQFKKVTGLTTRHFKKIGDKKRDPLGIIR